MEYRKIVSVTGLSGLYELVTTKRDGAIVRGLDDKSTRFVSARIHNATPLESIEIYTVSENVRLHEVFQKMKDSSTPPLKGIGKTTPAEQIKGYFEQVVPEMDFDRVYLSDMKRILRWYEILETHDLLHFESLMETEGQQEEDQVTEDTTEETAPAPKPKKKASKSKTESGEEPGEKAPKAKKSTRTGSKKEKDKEESKGE